MISGRLIRLLTGARFALVLTILTAFVCLHGPAAAANLIGVRFGETSQTETRIVFDVSGPVDYSISGNDQSNGRLAIDIKGVFAPDTTATGAGHIGAYRISSIDAVTQVVFEFSKTAKIKDSFLLKPSGAVTHYRLVIDLQTADKKAFLASIPRRYEDLTKVLEAVTAPTRAAEIVNPTIVIDPGHGGSDPGASGPGGAQEKIVTLAAAKKLAEILNERGRYNIVLTRADDTRLDLDGRSKAARDASPSLFISLHADAHGDADLRGGSVYTLSEQGSRRSAREALSKGDYKLNDTNLANEDPVLGGILFDVTQTANKNASSQFAELLVKNLVGVTPMVNNSHRTGDLFVLLAPDVPAVLFELAFISNKKDAENLTSPTWRAKTMTAVADAIDDYFDRVAESRHAFYAGPGQN